MNHLKSITKFQNKYFVLRHGESLANVQGIIISKPENGLTGYGLSAHGRQQVIDSLVLNQCLDNRTVIFASDFKRAKETAEIVQSILKVNKINITMKLRERNFGELEKLSDYNYQSVWNEDLKSPDHHQFQVESVNDVLKRTTELIVELEKLYCNNNILLVAHCDVLKILECGFKSISPCLHRNIAELSTAEIRELI